MGVRASISKPTPFIYPAFEKTDPFIYLIVQNVDPFIYCPLTFIPIYCLSLDKYSNQLIEYQENKQPRQISERKKYTHLLGCQKSGAFHIRIKKNRVRHILFVENREPIIHLAALKKGAIRHAHPYYVIYRKLPLRDENKHNRERSRIIHQKHTCTGDWEGVGGGVGRHVRTILPHFFTPRD